METVVIIINYLNKQDWKIIRTALKEKKILVKDVMKKLELTKAEFYNIVCGRTPVSYQFMQFIDSLNVVLTYGGNRDGR